MQKYQIFVLREQLFFSIFFILNFLVYFEIVAFHIDEGQAGAHAFM